MNRLVVVFVAVLTFSVDAFGGRLHNAVLRGDLDRVKELVREQSKSQVASYINAKSNNSKYPGNSAISIARHMGHSAIVEFLLLNGARENKTRSKAHPIKNKSRSFED